MNNNPNTNITEVIAEQAAQWMTELENNENSVSTNKSFLRWLKISPLHIQEFLIMTYIMLDIENNESMQNLDDIIKFYRLESNVIPITKSFGKIKTVETLKLNNKRKNYFMLATAALLMVSFSFVLSYTLNNNNTVHQQYFTMIGEQRSITLKDGSIINLNTDTDIVVVFSKSLRQIELLNGEAAFNVTKDPKRPFRVVSGSAFVEVVGTEFNMYKDKKGSTTVTVTEGLVQIGSNKSNEQTNIENIPKPLKRGEQIKIDSNGQLNPIVNADLETAMAWKDKKLIFNNESLQQVITQFNRYNKKKIIIKDEQLKLKKINGTFDATDAKLLLEFLSKTEKIDVTVNKFSNEWEISAK